MATPNNRFLKHLPDNKIGLLLLPPVPESELVHQMERIDAGFAEILRVAENLSELGAEMIVSDKCWKHLLPPFL